MTMTNLNALIARGVDIKAPPDPFEQYGRMQQLEANAQASQLNRMKVDEYTRGIAEQNALRRLDPTATDYLAQVSRINPKTGFEFGKLQQEQDTAKLTQQKTKMELAAAKQKFVQQAQRDTSRNPSDANITAFKEDLMANPDFTDIEKAQMAAGADRLLSMPINERRIFMSTQGATAGELIQTQKGTRQNVDLGGMSRGETIDFYGNVVPASTTNTQKTQTKDSIASNARIAAEGALNRTNATNNANASRAPVVKTIADPTDPNKSIVVDVRTYKGGNSGVGVIGGAPATAFAQKQSAGRAQLGKDIDLAVKELTEITKDGGLIDQSTGSGAGTLVDKAAGFVGKSTPGALAIGKLKPIADMTLKMVPRFEGPQSDKDTQSYKEAAGQLADSTLPTDIRKAAGKTVLRLMKARKGQFTTNALDEQMPPPSGNDVFDAADAILNGG